MISGSCQEKVKSACSNARESENSWPASVEYGTGHVNFKRYIRHAVKVTSQNWLLPFEFPVVGRDHVPRIRSLTLARNGVRCVCSSAPTQVKVQDGFLKFSSRIAPSVYTYTPLSIIRFFLSHSALCRRLLTGIYFRDVIIFNRIYNSTNSRASLCVILRDIERERGRSVCQTLSELSTTFFVVVVVQCCVFVFIFT
jgi:hypothetical protein